MSERSDWPAWPEAAEGICTDVDAAGLRADAGYLHPAAGYTHTGHHTQLPRSVCVLASQPDLDFLVFDLARFMNQCPRIQKFGY